LLLLLETVPIYIQFVTFSLLIVFLIKCLLSIKEQFTTIDRVLYPCYVLLLLGLGFGTYLFSHSAAKELNNGTSTHDAEHGFDHGVSYFAAVVFGLLTLCVGVTGLFTFRTLNIYIPKGSKRRAQVDVFSYISMMYFVVFLARAIWSLTYVFNKNGLQAKMNHWEKLQTDAAQDAYYQSILIFYMFFEVLPYGALALASGL
jgi:hypothetical protein